MSHLCNEKVTNSFLLIVLYLERNFNGRDNSKLKCAWSNLCHILFWIQTVWFLPSALSLWISKLHLFDYYSRWNNIRILWLGVNIRVTSDTF